MWEHDVGVQAESSHCVWCPSLMPGAGAKEAPRSTVLQKPPLECWDWILCFEGTQASLACLAMANTYESK